MLGGRLPPEVAGGGAFGLRAFCNMPRGVEEALIGGGLAESETDRRPGTRWVFVSGLPTGEDSSEEGGDFGLAGPSIELFGGVPMAGCMNLSS